MLGAFFGANAFVSFFAAYMLQYIWGMINALQMIVLTALFAFQIPFNAQMLMISILDLVSLEFIDTGFLLEEIFDFRETDAFGTYEDEYGGEVSQFAESGFETSNFIELLGSVFFVIILTVAFQLFISLLKLLTRSL